MIEIAGKPLRTWIDGGLDIRRQSVRESMGSAKAQVTVGA